MPTRSKKKGAWLSQGALILCLLLSALFMGLFLRDQFRARREDKANVQLRQQLRQAEAALPQTPAETPREEGAPLPQYEALWQQNRDFAGWLRIEGTAIDYPVMHTPEEPERYLRKAFDGSYAVSGSLFLDGACTPDGPHALIYGHEMKNGTMFGSLSDYASADYAKEHPLIQFDTLTEQGSYQVVAAFYSRIYTDQDQDVFRYYQYADLSDPADFEDYVQRVKAEALYDCGVEVQAGDRLLTLSTCSSHTENGRFVVVACQKAPQEQ